MLLIKAIDIAEMSSVCRWPERVKSNKMASFMRGRAERYLIQHVSRYWAISPNMWYIMEQMNAAFKVIISNH